MMDGTVQCSGRGRFAAAGGVSSPVQKAAFFSDSVSMQEYFLVVQPTLDVHGKIAHERSYFTEQYQWGKEDHNLPRLVLANFRAKDFMEDMLIRWMLRICSGQQKFSLTFNNYSGIPAHSIYLRVMDHQPIQDFLGKLRFLDEYLLSNECPPIRFEWHPHLNIAAFIPPAIYDQALKEYAERSFSESFEVNELVLMRRDPGKRDKVVQVFRLKPGER